MSSVCLRESRPRHPGPDANRAAPSHSALRKKLGLSLLREDDDNDKGA